MPQKFFKRWIPNPQGLKNQPGLKFLGVLLEDPYLFHLNRHSISAAFAVGLFIAFLPIPGQVPLVALSAAVLRCNLPIAFLLIMVSNPFTVPIIFYAAYKVGASILHVPPMPFHFELSWQWLSNGFLHVWEPLILGCLLASFFFSALGYLFIQWLWRWQIVRRWNRRKHQRMLRSATRRNRGSSC
ncbi:MAG: DUF2062 domain-containing protein [Cellvibrionaceae bacterium]|nr:DUF2062 domain-containing protein [Cellvibrionaceae bacterium]